MLYKQVNGKWTAIGYDRDDRGIFLLSFKEWDQGEYCGIYL